MKKYLLFLIIFIASGMTGGSFGGKSFNTFNKIDDFYYMHPKNTTSSGLAEMTDSIISKNIIINDEEVQCMAKNIFFEAAIESTAGKLAVAQVTLNRVDSHRFPNTVCEVVYEGPHYTARDGQLLPKRDRCQFSWYCDGKHDDPREGSRLWKDSQELAKYILLKKDELLDITDGALHYHASYIRAPKWAARKTVTTKIDQHIFYSTRYNQL
jgi:spore germination cell wall hydrolase CwlJ-like protein